MAYSDTTAREVLLRIVARLQAALSLTDATCFLGKGTDTPADEQPNPGNYWLIVHDHGGQYDEAMVDGGGTAQMTAVMTVGVKICTPIQQDELGHATEALTDSSLGLGTIFAAVRGALACHVLLKANGDDIVREPIMPLGWQPSRDEGPWSTMVALFRVMFDEAAP